MLNDKYILAVVPARSGSKGVPGKNMRLLRGLSLIGWTGKVLSRVPIIDRRVISTDSEVFAAEGERYGLEASFLRPAELSTDSAGAVETMRHAVTEMERLTGHRFDIILIVEPISPLRLPSDIEKTIQRLEATGADSVVCVSPLPPKWHPHKVLDASGGKLAFFDDLGKAVVSRQTLSQLYWRNGVCYALTRACLMEKAVIISDNTVPEHIEHAVVNIDEPWELDWAEFLLEKRLFVPAWEEPDPASTEL